MEQQTTAAANINKDKLGPPLLDNGEGKQLFLVIKHKSTISKNNGKNKQTKEQSATMMASANEQNNEGMAEADKQASPPIQHGKTHSQSTTHTPKGAAMTINGACPTVPNQPSEGIKCPSPTLDIPKKDGASREITMNLEGLQPPTFDSAGEQVTGAETNKLQLQNRRRTHALQDEQDQTSM
jgi:hypothetical protein